ncbi:acyl carrier protein [Qiania dongpingensis]|uniref:Acyl carrier protein n=1 Tax=Qiania dongpingensis TaxID=2763669 RepID=A0A7G9G1S9_9FIRM|nr:acyl carrier protein [Qiania dongpingensis]QNM04761.1 acyl carrier protein [Qiania dongpingensis]
MEVWNIITQKIEDIKDVTVPITRESHLYTDLGFDSLAFVSLLFRLEEDFQISFGITEIEQCLQAGRLSELMESKIRERERVRRRP